MRATYFITWSLCNLALRTYFRCRIYHAERVPRTGPVILASNHASHLDPPLVGIGVPRDIHYLARKTLFRFPPVGWVLRSVNSVPVDRDGGGAAGLRAILDRLLAGQGIVLFPEGTRSPDGRLQLARSGVGLAVAKSNAPVVPVRVFGTFAAYGRHARWPRPYSVAVKYGLPMDFRELREAAARCPKTRVREVYQEIADQIMQAISRLEPCWDKTTFP